MDWKNPWVALKHLVPETRVMLWLTFLPPKMRQKRQIFLLNTSTLTILSVLIGGFFYQGDVLLVDALGLRTVLRGESSTLREPGESLLSAAATTQETNTVLALVKQEENSAIIPSSFAQTIPSKREREFVFCTRTGVPSTSGSNLISTASLSSALLCQSLCQQVPECQLFAYSSERSNGCFLFRAEAIGSVTTDSSWVYGPRVCDEGLAYIDVKTEYPGYNIVYFTSTNAQTCSDDCLRDSRCDAFTYFQSNSRCFLKTYESAWSRKTNSNAVSSPRPKALCIEKAIRYYGIEVGRCNGVKSAPLCQLLCRKDPSCSYFSYNIEEGSCLFHSSGRGKVYDANFASGPAQCTDPTPVALSEEAVRQTTYLQLGRVYQGLAVEALSVADTVIDCISRCRRNKNCFVFSYDVETAECKQMTRESLLLARYTDLDSISGFGSASTNCFVEGVQYQGTELAKLGSWSPLECQHFCQITTGCQFFHYGSGTCTMLKNKSWEQATTGYTSGSADCLDDTPILNYTPNNEYSKCFLVGFEFSGPRATGQSILYESVEDCLFKCRQTAGCMWFSHDALTKKCDLWADAAVMTRSSLEYSVSGPAFCADCVQENTRYSGTLVGEPARTQTVEECMGRCRHTSNCTHVRWSADYLTCDMLKDITGSTPEAGRQSAPSTCP